MGYQNVLQWLDEDQYVVVNGYMYDGKKREEQPFIFVDVERKRVAFLPFMNSCHSFIESEESCWIIRERDQDPRFRSRDGEKFYPHKLHWSPWDQIDELKALYWKGELGSAL